MPFSFHTARFCAMAVAIQAACLCAVRAADPATAPVEDAATGPTTEQTTQPTTTAVYTGPLKKVDRLTDLFHLSIRDGFLALDTDLKPTPSPLRIQTPALPNGAEIFVSAAPGAPDDLLRFFRFITPPSATIDATSITDINVMANRVQISQGSEIDGGLRNVQYIQQIPFDVLPPGNAPVALHVEITAPAPGAPVKMMLTADSFNDLCDRYPREMATYFLPILEYLQQDASIFAPDPAMARQALLPEKPADAATEKQVKALIAQLASPSSTERDAALASLQKLGRPAAAVAAGVDRATLSADQNSLIDAFIAGQLPAAPEQVQRLAEQPAYLLRCLYLDDLALRASAANHLKAITHLPLTFDPAGSPAMRSKQVMKIWTQVNAWAATQPSASEDR
jgi:hypothetical protein